MATQYSFYTIVADAYIYDGSEDRTEVDTKSWSNLFSDAIVNTTQFPIIVDSGTTLLYLPTGTIFDSFHFERGRNHKPAFESIADQP